MLTQKKTAARTTVVFTSTFEVCAPQTDSVKPPPNAAPRPSCLLRCMRMTRHMSGQVTTSTTRKA